MKKYLFIAIAAATVLAACSKEPAIVEQPSTSSCRTIKAVFDPTTKAAVNGLKFSFTVGDGITVYNGTDYAPVYYICNDVTDGVATFIVGTDTPNQPDETITELIATFPRRSAATGSCDPDTQELRLLLPTNHAASTAETMGYDPTAIPFVAYSEDNESTLTFKQTVGIVELTLKGDAKISSISLEAEDVISGYCNVSYTADAPEFTPEDGATNQTANYTYQDVQLTEDGVKFYFALPVGSHNVKFTFSDDSFGSMTKTAKGLTVSRGEMIPTTLTYAGTMPASTQLDADDAYANCYVIPESGLYCFTPTKPDGTAVECASADWVWATSAEWNPTTWDGFSTTDVTYYNKLADNVKLINGKIYVNATMSTTGNLIVGALDEDGTLTWSWNIWLTNNLADVTSGDYTWMDRNLGAGYKTDVTNNTATQTNAARGMYYQAGRKDPILGPHGNGTGTFPNLVKNAGQALYVYNSNISGLSGWGIGSVALADDVAALNAPMSLVASQDNLPNYNASTCWTTNSNPCPYGYVVATQAAYVALGSDCTLTANGASKQVAVGGVVFPVSGYRNASDGARKEASTSTKANASIRMWTSTAVSSKTNMHFYKYLVTNDGTVTASDNNSGRANGNSVRCIKAN